MVVNELVPVVVCVPFLVLIRMLQGKPFAAVGFDVPNEMDKNEQRTSVVSPLGVR